MADLQRATSIDEYFEKIGRMCSDYSSDYARSFSARQSDIIIATFPKAGTTWMQQIVHGLRSHGDMAFAEITEVVPWIEMAGDLGIDLAASHDFEPRAFKSHQSYNEVAKGCRYICVIRDPFDSAVSMFNFMLGWFIQPGTISLDEFVQAVFMLDIRKFGYWQHLLSWWPARNNPEVLFLCYEDMHSDLAGSVGRVAEFTGVSKPETIALATQQASFDFMKKHNRQFDDHLISDRRNAACGLPAESVTSKIKSGKSGGAQALLSAQTITALQRAWQDTVGQSIGIPDYRSLRLALHEEQKQIAK